jgi:hypothetical protein
LVALRPCCSRARSTQARRNTISQRITYSSKITARRWTGSYTTRRKLDEPEYLTWVSRTTYVNQTFTWWQALVQPDLSKDNMTCWRAGQHQLLQWFVT